MKNKLGYIIIAIFCFSSCGNIETSIEQNNDTSTVSKINEDSSLEKAADVPPVWLKEIIQKKTEKIQAEQDGMGRYRIKKFNQINNSLSYAITNAFIDGIYISNVYRWKRN